MCAYIRKLKKKNREEASLNSARWWTRKLLVLADLFFLGIYKTETVNSTIIQSMLPEVIQWCGMSVDQPFHIPAREPWAAGLSDPLQPASFYCSAFEKRHITCTFITANWRNTDCGRAPVLLVITKLLHLSRRGPLKWTLSCSRFLPVKKEFFLASVACLEVRFLSETLTK